MSIANKDIMSAIANLCLHNHEPIYIIVLYPLVYAYTPRNNISLVSAGLKQSQVLGLWLDFLHEVLLSSTRLQSRWLLAQPLESL